MAKFIVFIALVALPSVCWAEVCSVTQYYHTYRQRTRYSSCGLFGWSRCTRYYTETVQNSRTVQECCAGDYGLVEFNCDGECPDLAARSAASECEGKTCRDFKCDRSSFDNTFLAYSVHENSNDGQLLFRADATCFVQFTCPDCSCTCSRNRRSILTEAVRNKRSTCTCSLNEPCSTCSVSNTQLFEVRNGVEIWRKPCESDCRDCSSESGCLDASAANNDVTVTCSGTGDVSDGAMATTFSLNIIAETKPVFNGQTYVINGVHGEGELVLEVDFDVDENAGPVSHTLSGATSPITGRTIFYINETDAGQIRANVDLSTEPSGEYLLELCVNTRRHSVCQEYSIVLDTFIPTTTPLPEDEITTTSGIKSCRGTGAWASNPGMNEWCQTNCNLDPPHCPETQCECGTQESRTRNKCVATGDYAGVAGMDDWCDLNCNMGEHSNCPETMCVCEEKIVN